MSMSSFRSPSPPSSPRPAPFRYIPRLTALAAAALALASCWHPAFDPAISGSEAVIRKLGEPKLLFTAENIEGWEMEDAWFVPVAADLALLSGTYGLLARPQADRIRFFPVWFDTALSQGWPDMFNGNELWNVYGERAAIIMAPNGNTSAVFIANPLNQSYIDPLTSPTTNPVAFPPSMFTFGSGYVHDFGINQATFTWIGMNAVLQPLYAPPGSWMGGAAPGYAGANVLQFDDFGLVSSPGLAFFTSATGYLYLSCGLSDGSRAIYRWLNPSTQEPVRFPEVYGSLTGALSDGRLLAEQDGVVTVLDPDLRRLFSFPAGKLRFVHERWDGTRMISVFTRTVFVRTDRDDDRGRLDVEVYEIPTADLHKLAD